MTELKTYNVHHGDDRGVMSYIDVASHWVADGVLYLYRPPRLAAPHGNPIGIPLVNIVSFGVRDQHVEISTQQGTPGEGL